MAIKRQGRCDDSKPNERVETGISDFELDISLPCFNGAPQNYTTLIKRVLVTRDIYAMSSK